MCEKINFFRKLDIVLWTLRYPVIFNDNIMTIQLWPHYRLLLISDSSISLCDPLINDVLRTIHLDVQEVCILTVSQIHNLIFPLIFSCHCWWIGVTKFRDFHGMHLYTSSLSALKSSVELKRDLWNQIIQIMYVFDK